MRLAVCSRLAALPVLDGPTNRYYRFCSQAKKTGRRKETKEDDQAVGDKIWVGAKVGPPCTRCV